MKEYKEQILNMRLCANRHNHPPEQTIDGYFFDSVKGYQITNPCLLEEIVRNKLKNLIDKDADRVLLVLTVTGLTVALISVINVCKILKIKLILKHFSRETKTYFEQ